MTIDLRAMGHERLMALIVSIKKHFGVGCRLISETLVVSG
jgi:hypothetical protein